MKTNRILVSVLAICAVVLTSCEMPGLGNSTITMSITGPNNAAITGHLLYYFAGETGAFAGKSSATQLADAAIGGGSENFNSAGETLGKILRNNDNSADAVFSNGESYDYIAWIDIDDNASVNTGDYILTFSSGIGTVTVEGNTSVTITSSQWQVYP